MSVRSKPRAATAPLRSRVVERSLGVFSEHGYEATSVVTLCDAAGISVGSLYHHFTSKAGVARAVYAEALRRYQESLHDVLSSDPGAEAGVLALVAAHHQWVAANPAWARFLFSMGDLPEIQASEEEWRTANDRLIEHLAEWAMPLIGTGGLLALEPGVLVAVLFGPSYMHSRAALSGRFSGAGDPARSEFARRAAEQAFGAAAWRALRGDGRVDKSEQTDSRP